MKKLYIYIYKLHIRNFSNISSLEKKESHYLNYLYTNLEDQNHNIQIFQKIDGFRYTYAFSLVLYLFSMI